MFSFVNSSMTPTKVCLKFRHCAARGYTNAALCSPQHSEVYEFDAFYAEKFGFFISRGHLTATSHKRANCCPWQPFSNQWAFTLLETEVFKYNFYIAKKCCVFC